MHSIYSLVVLCTSYNLNTISAGMHLTAKVTCTNVYKETNKSSFQVFVQVDRGCITATSCSCGTKEWCTHILALIMARLRQDSTHEIHLPLSETLSKFSRDELQKLLQYFVEHVPLEGVPAVQECVCAVQDTASKESNCATVPGMYNTLTNFILLWSMFTCLCMVYVHEDHTVLSVHADTTAGCNTGEGPMWYIDQESLLHSLEVVCKKFFPALCAPFTPFTSHLLRSKVSLTPTIVDFQQFTKGEKPSVFAFLLQHDCRHIVYVLKWALDKMIQSFNRSPAHYEYNVHDGELEWLVVALISSYHSISQ